MQRLLSIFLPILLILNCSGPEYPRKGNQQDILFTETTGKAIPLDSVELPVAVLAGKPDTIRLKPPNKIAYSSNKTKAESPIRIKAKPPTKNTPGIGPFLPPDTIKAVERIVPYIIPEQTEAKDAFSKALNPHSFSIYNKIQGLTHTDIPCIIEDDKGNIWFATWGGGVTKYDGKYFTHFNQRNGLSNNAVRDIIQDRNGDLWFATYGGGVSRFNGYNFIHYTTDEGLNSNNIMSLIEDKNGDIWLSSWDNGIARFDGESFITYTTEQGLSNNGVLNSIEDNTGTLWFAFNDGTVSAFDGKSFYNYSTEQGLPGDFIFTIYQDTNDVIWLGTSSKGIASFDGDYFYHYPQENLFDNSTIYSIKEDKDGLLWFSIWGRGVAVFDGDSFRHFDESKGMSSNYIMTIFEDTRSNIWFGHWGGGVSKYFGKVFNHYTEKEGLVDNYIFPVFQDKKGHFWIGSNGGGLNTFDGKYFYQYTNEHGLQSNIIWDGILDSNGDIWFSIGNEGVTKFDGSNLYHYGADQGLSEHIVKIFKDSENNLWLASFGGGIIKFDGNNFTKYSDANGFIANIVYSVLEDRNGNIWFGTWGEGVCRFDGEIFTYFKNEHGLARDFVFSIAEDALGNIWFGTNDGLSMYNGHGILSLFEKDGLSNNAILSLLNDIENNLWIGTRSAINKLSLDALKKIDQYSKNNISVNTSFLFETFSYFDGFFGIGCNRNSIYQDNEGDLWIGANDRLTKLNPKNITPDTIPPTIEITDIGLFNEKIYWSQLQYNQDTIFRLGNGVQVKNFSFDSIGRWYGLPENLVLAHNNNNLTFSFIGITTKFPAKVKYSYFLEGIDKTWNNPTYRPEAHYGNLPHGRYTFKVKAYNSLGYASEEYHYTFTIKPPIWKTWWAYAIYVICAALLLLSFTKYRERSLRLKNKLLDNEVDLAWKTLEFKKNFLANMSHEIRTPLTGILGLTDILIKNNPADNQKEYLLSLKQSGENLKAIINLILDYSKIETGQVKLKNELFSLKEIFVNNEKLFYTFADKKEITFSWKIDKKIPQYIISDRQRVNSIISNLIINAAKFTLEGKVMLKAVLMEEKPLKTDNELTIKTHVVDTGIGINSIKQKNLFTPFSEIEQKDNRNSDSTGLGLAISKDFANILGGEIDFESETGKGSDFWFTFKAKKAKDQNTAIELLLAEKAKKLKPLNILLVEDKRITQTVVKLQLESKGHKIEIAQNGQEAVDIFKPGMFDVIIMDIQMPVMDGITATKTLKQKYKDNLPPIIGFSANAFEGDRERYMEQGMDDYLNKPLNENEFERVVKSFVK